MQEALARAWERSDRGERIESVKAWVTKVALNLVRSRWRRLWAEYRAADRMGIATSPSSDDLERRLDLREGLRRLPRLQRNVTLLHYYLGLPVEEVAKTLGVSAGTVKTSLHRARRTLAAKLAEEDYEETKNRGP